MKKLLLSLAMTLLLSFAFSQTYQTKSLTYAEWENNEFLIKRVTPCNLTITYTSLYLYINSQVEQLFKINSIRSNTLNAMSFYATKISSGASVIISITRDDKFIAIIYSDIMYMYELI